MPNQTSLHYSYDEIYFSYQPQWTAGGCKRPAVEELGRCGNGSSILAIEPARSPVFCTANLKKKKSRQYFPKHSLCL